eukprot:1435303-Prymnesium_polylepis.1
MAKKGNKETYLDRVIDIIEEGFSALNPYTKHAKRDCSSGEDDGYSDEDRPAKFKRSTDRGAPSPPPSERSLKHSLAPISMLADWDGSNQITCGECRAAKVGWYCVDCSSSTSIVALHPPAIGDNKYGCAGKHRLNRCTSREIPSVRSALLLGGGNPTQTTLETIKCQPVDAARRRAEGSHSWAVSQRWHRSNAALRAHMRNIAIVIPILV